MADADPDRRRLTVKVPCQVAQARKVARGMLMTSFADLIARLEHPKADAGIATVPERRNAASRTTIGQKRPAAI